MAVEGPSAAGKTSWCRGQDAPVVAEYEPTGLEPDGSDPARQAAYWVEVNSGRWREAVTLERSRGQVVVCDSDPLKLHYSWCLARIGAAPRSRFDHELAQVRTAFVRGRLGLVDLVLVSIPEPEVLCRQKTEDRTRRRRTFELHARLAAPLREWYSALGEIDPARVIWSFPPTGVPVGIDVRPVRSDSAALEMLLENLPPLA